MQYNIRISLLSLSAPHSLPCNSSTYSNCSLHYTLIRCWILSRNHERNGLWISVGNKTLISIECLEIYLTEVLILINLFRLDWIIIVNLSVFLWDMEQLTLETVSAMNPSSPVKCNWRESTGIIFCKICNALALYL